jgi:hypothetical protein
VVKTRLSRPADLTDRSSFGVTIFTVSVVFMVLPSQLILLYFSGVDEIDAPHKRTCRALNNQVFKPAHCANNDRMGLSKGYAPAPPFATLAKASRVRSGGRGGNIRRDG